MSFLEAGDIRAFMRAPTILRYLRRGRSTSSAGPEPDRGPRPREGQAGGRVRGRGDPPRDRDRDPRGAPPAEAAGNASSRGCSQLRAPSAEPQSSPTDIYPLEGSLVPMLHGVPGEG